MTRAQLAVAPLEAARRLLGATLRVGEARVRLVDVEAYGGGEDPASHAFRGRTARNASMFGPPGLLYVYLSYGIHHCANVVCGEEGQAAAVLIRGVQLLEGVRVVERRMGQPVLKGRVDGPGRVCRALGIGAATDGLDLMSGRAALLRIPRDGLLPGERVVATPRVGISRAAERPWRLAIMGHPTAG